MQTLQSLPSTEVTFAKKGAIVLSESTGVISMTEQGMLRLDKTDAHGIVIEKVFEADPKQLQMKLQMPYFVLTVTSAARVLSYIVRFPSDSASDFTLGSGANPGQQEWTDLLQSHGAHVKRFKDPTKAIVFSVFGLMLLMLIYAIVDFVRQNY